MQIGEMQIGEVSSSKLDIGNFVPKNISLISLKSISARITKRVRWSTTDETY